MLDADVLLFFPEEDLFFLLLKQGVISMLLLFLIFLSLSLSLSLFKKLLITIVLIFFSKFFTFISFIFLISGFINSIIILHLFKKESLLFKDDIISLNLLLFNIP